MFFYNSVRVLDLSFCDFIVPLDVAFPDRSRRIVRKILANFVKRALLAAGTGIEHQDLHELVRPFPVFHLRHVVTVLVGVLFVLD